MHDEVGVITTFGDQKVESATRHVAGHVPPGSMQHATAHMKRPGVQGVVKVASCNRALWVDSFKGLYGRTWVLRTMSTCIQRDRRVAFPAEDCTDEPSHESVSAQGALIHATSAKLKFLGVYIGVTTEPKGKRQYLKALEKRRRVIHRLRMLQKQRKESWEKEVGRLALNAFTRGYRKALNTFKSGPKARQAISDKATELGMKAALALTDRQPLLGSDDFKKLLEEEEEHFSRLGWDFLPASVKLAYENFLLAMDKACAELKAQSAFIKSQEVLSNRNQQLFNIDAYIANLSSAITEQDESDSVNFSDKNNQCMPTSTTDESAADTVGRTPESNCCVEGIMKRIASPDSLEAAYERIKSKLQIMSMKNDEEWDDLDSKSFTHTAHLLRAGTYQFTPVSRVHVRKPGKEGAVRSVTVVNPRDQIIAEAVRVELERIYEPVFLDSFRGHHLSRSSHMALKFIKNGWKGTTWFIQFKIQNVSNKSQHEKLMSILAERIKDDQLLNLLTQMFKMGAISLGDRGSRLSALLCNIYYHQLDVEVAHIRADWNMGSMDRKRTSASHNPLHQLQRANQSQHALENDYVRVRYVRYAEEFLFGITGSKTIALDVLERVKGFLHSELKLQLH